jgi:hypothetical protein
MKKIFTIALLCAMIGFFSTGCVDVAAPSGSNDPANPNAPTNPDEPNNPSNPSTPSNPSNPTDPNDPMYPGEAGTYFTTWNVYDQTQSSQRYIGVDYDEQKNGEAPNNVGVTETAPYRTTFSDGVVSYSIVPFEGVAYTYDYTLLDCCYVGEAPDGFIVSDYNYDSSNGTIKAGDGTQINSTGTTEGTYSTFFTQHEIVYVTKQPILTVSYTKSSTGENYLGVSEATLDMFYFGPYVTKWDSGDYTLSIYSFAGVSYYGGASTTTYSADSTERNWLIGTAPSGHKESDYQLNVDEYKYIGSSAATSTPPTTQPPAEEPAGSDPLDDLIEDAEDVLDGIFDNDGLRL